MENRKQLLEGELKVIQSRMEDIYNTLNGDFNLDSEYRFELVWEYEVLTADAQELSYEISNL